MKVVYIAVRSLDGIGGTETYMKNLCPALVQKGVEVILYSGEKKWGSYDYKGVKVITVPSYGSKFWNKILLAFLSTVHSIIFNRKVSIYHFNAIPSGVFSILPILLKKNVVFQGHGFEWKRAKWSPKIQKAIRRVDNFVLRVNKNLTMVSDEQSNYIRKKFKKDAITINTAVTIKTDLTFVEKSKILSNYNLIENKYFLYLGRLVQEKKADILIEAFKNLDTDWKLVIAGDDPNEKEFIKQLHDSAKSNMRIIFTGAVFDDDKERLLQKCGAFCIPSELEGLAITLLEAMSYKRICIASDIPANKEGLGDTGLYFPVNKTELLTQKMKYVTEEFNNCIEKGNQAYERINDKFTWGKIGNQFFEFYSKILNI